MIFKQPYQLFITRQLNEDVAESPEMVLAVRAAVERFNNGDWGDMCQDDIEANNEDLDARIGRVLARYPTPNGDIYINLNFDDPSIESDAALIMYCSEY